MDRTTWDWKAPAGTEWRFPEELLPRCRDRQPWKELRDPRREQILSRAEGYLGYAWPALPATAFMQYCRSGDRLAWETPSYARRGALETLVMAECIENGGRFMDDIVNGIWCICEETYWGVSAHHFREIRPLPDVEEPYIDLFAACTGELLALTLYLLEDKLSDIAGEIPRRIRYELKRRLVEPFLKHDDFWWMGYGHAVNNWNPWILSQLIPVFLLGTQGSVRKAGMDRIIEQMGNYYRSIPEDGGCDEGVSYWNMAGGSFFDCLYLLDKASGGRFRLWEDSKVRRMVRYPVSMHVSGDCFVNYADGSSRPELSGGVLLRYGRQVEDRDALRLGAALFDRQRQTYTEKAWEFCRRLLDLFEPVGEPVPPPDTLDERDAVFPVLQQAVFRESGEEARGWFLSAKGGNNAESHNHNDVGSCVLYMDGMPVLIDAGVGVYTRKTFSEQRYEIWTMQSGWHNLPVVNGFDQLDGERYRAEKADYARNGGTSVYALEIGAAYPPEAGLQGLERTYMLDRQARTVSLTDAFALKKEKGKLEEHFLLSACPEISGSEIRIPLSSGAAVQMRVPQDWEASVERRPIDDPRLRQSCGSVVYRLCLTKEDCAPQERFVVTFQCL